MTKITYRWSDWNGMKADKAYHNKPTAKQIQEIMEKRFIRTDDLLMVRDEAKTIIEVRGSTGNLYSCNTYRDIYKIN